MPEMSGPETCKIMLEVYDHFMHINELDSEEEALARSQIFKPEIVCCSAYDAAKIIKSLNEVGIVEVLAKPPKFDEMKEILIKVKENLIPKYEKAGL